MNTKRILIIEDDRDVLELEKYNLKHAGYEVYTAMTGSAGLLEASKILPDTIVLDLMLPEMDGLEVCKQLRLSKKTAHIPIIMVTAKGEEHDVVSGLEAGADDYITKPFSPKILIARVNTILRRIPKNSVAKDNIITIHDIEIHPGRFQVTVAGQEIKLTSSEFALLHFLSKQPGWVFTRYQIVDAIHGTDYPVTDRSVDVQIVGLRKKLGNRGKYIETIRGIGYRFMETQGN